MRVSGKAENLCKEQNSAAAWDIPSTGEGVLVSNYLVEGTYLVVETMVDLSAEAMVGPSTEAMVEVVVDLVQGSSDPLPYRILSSRSPPRACGLHVLFEDSFS